MKNNGKTSKPIIAAHSANNSGNQTAPPGAGKGSGARTRGARASSDKVKSLVLERIQDGILAFDAEMNHVYVNDRAGELFGKNPKELLGKNFRETYPQSAGTPLADACRRAFETQTVVPFDGYFPPSDTWLEGRVYPSHDGLSVLISDREPPQQEDPAQREPGDEKLREASQFPMQNPNPVMCFSQEGKLLFANPAADPLLQAWKEQNAQGLPQQLRELLPPLMASASNREIEIKNQGKTYSCLLVAVPERGYINLYFNDITERKQAQESLQALVQQTTTGITRTDLDGRFLFINQAFCNMLGYSEAELIGKTIWEISHPDDIARNRHMFKRMIADGEPYQLEKRLLRRNGTIVWVSVGCAPLRDAPGKTHSAVSVVVDISRRKRAEETLVDSARRTWYLSSLSDALRPLANPLQIESEGARILGMHLKANRVAYASIRADGAATVHSTYTNGAPELTSEFSLSKYIPPENLSSLRAGRAYITGGMENSTNGKSLTAANEPSVIPSQVVIPLIRQGELVAALFVQQFQGHDWKNEEIRLMEETAERMQMAIEHARAERDLRESEQKFSLIYENLPFAAALSRPEDGVVVDVNREFERVFGYSKQDVVGRTSLELGINPDAAGRAELLAQMKAQGSARNQELKLLTKDKGMRDFSINLDLVTINGEKYILQTAQDITERKLAEEWEYISTQNLLAAAEANAKFRTFFDQGSYFAGVMTLDGTVVEANRLCLDFCGFRREDVIGKKFWDCGWWNPSPELMEMIRRGTRQAAQGMLFHTESTYYLADGSARYVDLIITPVKDEHGRLLFLAPTGTDITERKRAEEQLRASEERFRALVSQTTAGISQADLESRLTFVNPRFCEMLGYTESELLGRTIWELTYSDDLQENIRLYTLMLNEGKSYQFEKRLVRKDGSHLWTSVSVTSIYDATGKPTGGVGVVLDISERKKIEEARRIENERFMRFLNANIIGIVIGDANGKVLLANDYYLNLLGVTRQDFVDEKVDWKKLTPPEWLAADEKSIRELQERGVSEPYEKEYLRADGTRVPVYIANASLPGDEIAAFVLDISDRKRAEEQLRISEDRLRLAVAAGNIGIWDIDLRRRERAWSKEGKAIYGLAEDEFLDYERQLSLVHPEDRALVDDMVTRFRDYGTLRQLNLEHRIVQPDGSLHWVEVQGEAIYEGGSLPVRLIGTIVDITERKAYERSLIEYGRRQTALYTLADRLHRTNSWDDVFHAALDAILNALQCDRASILLFDETKVMHFVAWRGLSDSYRKATDGHSPWKYGEQNPTPIFFNDITTADLSDSLKAVIAAEGIGSLAFIPIVFQGTLMGKFMVYFDAPHNFHEDELDLGVTIARQLAAGVDRKRNEDALRESQQRLSLTYDHAAIGIVETNLAGKFIQCNDEYCRLVGYPKGEIIQLSIEDITYEEDRQLEKHLSEELIAGNIPFYRMEKRYVRKDGSLVWGEVVRSLVHDSTGKALYAIGAVFDITERKHREEAIRARTEEIETLMEVNPIGIFVAHDPECRRITANPAGYELVELPKSAYANVSKSAPVDEQLSYKVFRNDVEVPAEDLPMQASARLGIAIEEKSLELRFAHGVSKHVYAFAKPLFDNNGNSRGAIAAMLDITDRIENENALRESEERFARFMQHLPGLAWIKDLQGRYVYANAAAEKAFNTPREKLYGKTDQEIFPAQIAAQFKLNDEQALVEGKGVQVVETLLQDDGILHHSLVTKFPIPGPDGATALIGGTAFDITERVQMEEALRQARKLAEKTADRMARLQEVTASLAVSSIPMDLAELVLKQGARATGAAAGILVEVLDNGKDLRTIAALGHPFALQMEPASLSTPAPLSDCIRTKQAIWIRSSEEFAAQYPLSAEAQHGPGNQATVALPLMVGDRVVGGLAFSFVEPREFQIEERGFFLAVAQQCAQGLERVHAEEALRESEERYRAIINQATAGIVRKAADGRMLFVNQAFCEMLGIIELELVGRPMWEFTHPDDVAENKRLFDRLMTEGIPFQLEKRLIRRDGSILWVTVSVSPVLDATGKPQSAVSVYADITERKQAQSRLELLAEVSDLIRNIDDPIELMSAVAQVVGQHLDAKRCLFNEIDIANDIEIVHSDYHEGTHSVAGVHKISEYSGVTSTEMEAGRTVVNYDSKIDPRTAADYERSYVPHGERAYVTVPLMREDRWAASLWVSDDKPRRWSKEEISLLETVAERTWTATEKLRINAALRDSEERLRVTFNTTAVGFATLQLDTRFVDVNEAFCEIVGYTRNELLNMNGDTLTHPDYLESMHDHVAQLIAGEIPFFVLEKLYIRKDGRQIWVENSVSIVRDADGNPLHLIAICQDVTERKQADEQLQKLNVELEERVLRRTSELQAAYEFLRESEATSRLILESMPDAIVITDKNGQIVYGNNQVESLFGYSAQEVIGQAVEMLIPERFHEDHIDYRLEYRQNLHRRSMGLGRELFGRRKDNSEFPVDVMLSPISNSTTWDVMITIRDNTEQKQAQEALRSNEEKLRKLFQILPVGISFLGNEGQILEMNSALTNILGLSKHQLLEGKHKPRKYIRADGSPMPSSEFASNRARLENRTIYNIETGIVKENGDTIWTSVNAAPVNVADVGVVVATIDITERKKAEDALHKNRERLRTLSRRLVEVQEEERRAIARELHDRVGQNLAALNLNLNILRSQLSEEALQIIGTRLDDSVSLVNQILTITRNVMADLRSNVLDDYGLESALREYAEQFSQRMGVQVVTEKSSTPIPRLDPSIEMTLLRIAQESLTNVARHAQAKQAIITVSADQEAVHMSIQDDGIGILSWQKANQPGSHGLRIIRERAEAFGGSLQVHSTYKKGTKIEVKIPLAIASPHKNPREKRS